MSARGVDVLETVTRYAAGYFPLYDPWGEFYWERLSVRAVLPVNAEAVGRAREMARRKRAAFEIRYSTAVEQVIGHLRQERIKPNTWVREQVVAIYRSLYGAGLLQTIEAWQGTGNDTKLVGGLLGIVLPGTFIAETMFGLVPEASKVCLCRLMEDCAAAGFEMIDVQTPHDRGEFGAPIKKAGRTSHPCIRLGERTMPIAGFMRSFQAAWRRAFSGGAREWLSVAMVLRQRSLKPEAAVRLPEGVSAMAVEQACRYLPGNTGVVGEKLRAVE